jgi:hypothetical protein
VEDIPSHDKMAETQLFSLTILVTFISLGFYALALPQKASVG